MSSIQEAEDTASSMTTKEMLKEQEGEHALTLNELTNDKKRRQFIDAYKKWDLWHVDPLTETAYYTYKVPSGEFLCVEERLVTRTDWHSKERPRPKYLGTDLRYAILTPGAHYHDCRKSITEMVAFLKEKPWEKGKE